MVAVVDPNADYTFSYDGLGRLDGRTLTTGGRSVAFDYAYDPAGRRTQAAAAVDGIADYLNDSYFDALGRLTRLEQHGASGGNAVAEKRVDFTYDAAGQLESLTRYGDLAGLNTVAASDYVFDALGRLTDLTHRDGLGAAIVDHDWTFDAAGRITGYTNTLDGTSDYTYDATGQLTDADHSFQTDEDYDYDANGNRTNPGYVTGDNNQLLSDGTYDYEYDAEGNRTRRVKISDGTTTEYAWDHRNRLTKVTFKDAAGTPTKIVEYAYDFGNRWIRKALDTDADGAADTTTVFIPDDNQIVLQYTDATLESRYLWNPAGVDQLLADEQLTPSATVLWALPDHLGTIRDLIDNAGQTIDHLTYDSFGNVTSEMAPTTRHLHLFTGKPFDPDTGLQNNINRWYDPATGRWTSEDPIGHSKNETNLYRYVGNRPCDRIDPDGHRWVQVTEGRGHAMSIPMKNGTFTFIAKRRSEYLNIDVEIHFSPSKRSGPQAGRLRPIQAMKLMNLQKDGTTWKWYRDKPAPKDIYVENGTNAGWRLDRFWENVHSVYWNETGSVIDI